MLSKDGRHKDAILLCEPCVLFQKYKWWLSMRELCVSWTTYLKHCAFHSFFVGQVGCTKLKVGCWQIASKKCTKNRVNRVFHFFLSYDSFLWLVCGILKLLAMALALPFAYHGKFYSRLWAAVHMDLENFISDFLSDRKGCSYEAFAETCRSECTTIVFHV